MTMRLPNWHTAAERAFAAPYRATANRRIAPTAPLVPYVGTGDCLERLAGSGCGVDLVIHATPELRIGMWLVDLDHRDATADETPDMRYPATTG